MSTLFVVRLVQCLQLILYIFAFPSLVAAQDTGFKQRHLLFNDHSIQISQLTLYRESYNAHSFLLNILFYKQDGQTNVVPIFESNPDAELDSFVDAPGDGECLRKQYVFEPTTPTTLLVKIDNNSVDDDTHTRITVFRFAKDDQAIPGFPPVRFEQSASSVVGRICDADRLDPGTVKSMLPNKK